MALIKCSHCEKEISDKAKVCPQCGQPVVLVTPAPEEKPILCEECGTEIPEGVDACPNCGCPVSINDEIVEETPQKVEVTAVNLPKMNQNTKKYIIIASVAVLAIIIAFFVGNKMKEQKLAEEAAQRSANYASSLKTASYTMLLGAIDAEDAGNLIKSVWYNAIYEEYDSETNKYTRPNGYYVDFNDALSNLFSDHDFSSKVSSIESNQELVAELMKDLKNPPEEYEDAYEAIKELYDAYTALTNLATNPTGSLQTFSQTFNEADTAVANCYDAMNLYID
ncbi:MAG: zinc ribbon domain-containing protein [Oscillospiraceae bacterium]|nr:zinc ribbon domain-containing protein [Oscillospiraceae bacterium]